MKKLASYLLLSLLIMSCATDDSIPEKVFPGDVVIKTQEEIDNFVKNRYTGIDGYLVIGNKLTSSNPNPVLSNISDLSGLSTLTRIGDQLEIHRNPMLRSLKGLDNITSIGSLVISRNTSLESLDDFKSLKIITNRPVRRENSNFTPGTITIDSNVNLTSITMLRNLTSDTVDFLGIYNSPGLTDLKGLESLKTISSGIVIRWCSELISLDGLQNVQGSTSSLYIASNLKLKSIRELSQINADLRYLTISRNSALESLEGLENITEASRFFEISWNSNLTSLDGLNGLQRIGNLVETPQLALVGNNKFTVVGNSKLQSLDGLDGLITIEGELAIQNNSQLMNFCSLESPLQNNIVFDDFTISNNLFNPSSQDILDGNCSQ